MLRCRGMPPEVAVRFRDKWLQKEVIRAAGLRTARSDVMEDIAYPDELPELSVNRVTRAQVLRMFEHCRDGSLPSDFD